MIFPGSPLALLLAVPLGLLALALVLYPLVRPAGRQAGASAEAGRELAGAAPLPLAPSEEETAARAALHEVELEYQLGNLTESDYRSLRERYLRRALLAIKERHTREKELDALIEERLRLLREEDVGRSNGV
ncbi:MAG: hypothetical protein IMW90_08735 [Thermogemmatispora sp.]|jgi:hypothetical protein|uniref:hypothetical protein n=1 Tax=Thermogemmatispora sp. TaxID=1968838 RepID=UPI001A09DD49|nr:hypothetical protein [Thermogemmatispora sp.]MBE3565798.1 hypothetical protein [Thermogemmatispora sp.]